MQSATTELAASVPERGALHRSGYLDDPALHDLAPVVAAHRDVTVLRYRPGRRVTLSARDEKGRPVVIKCVARGIDTTVGTLARLHRMSDRLGFDVSRPLWRHPAGTVFAQTLLPGAPLRLDAAVERRERAHALGTALASLHRSGAVLERRFTHADQRRRSTRYAEIMRREHAPSGELADALLERLASLECAMLTREEKPRAAVPIHGSPHSGKWLQHGAALALIDFDRCAMGDPELDVATFVAEWDLEPAALGEPIVAAFTDAFTGLDPLRFRFYRAHKHLAEALEALSSTGVDARAKAQRNLGRALRIAERASAADR